MYSAGLHKRQGTAGNQHRRTASTAQENADVTLIRLRCAGQVSLILQLAFLAAGKTSRFALFYRDLEKEFVFQKTRFFPNNEASDKK